MSRRAASWLAWSLGGLSVVMYLASVALWFLARSAQEVPGSSLGDLLLWVPFLAFPLVGALIASRRPSNPIGWICLVAGFFWMLIAFGDSSNSFVHTPVAIDALTQWIWIPPVGLLGIYLILLFPDGRFPSRRWRSLAWLAAAVMVLASLGITLTPGALEDHPGVRNPFGLEGAPWITWATVAIILLLPVCILASALSLALRYRRCGQEVREQIKWLAFAASFVGVVYLSGLLSQLFFAPEVLGSNPDEQPLWVSLEQHLLLLSYVGVPIAVGFAVLKYRLYDIDVVINRTLVYASLTVMLALVYRGSILMLQGAFNAFTGRESQLAVVVSTLAMAALFNPLRSRVQSLVDRRFYRSKYDAAKTIEAFSTRLRRETDLDTLTGHLVGAVRETMQPTHISLWLRPNSASEVKQPDS